VASLRQQTAAVREGESSGERRREERRQEQREVEERV
jgi:hypothetical protein